MISMGLLRLRIPKCHGVRDLRDADLPWEGWSVLSSLVARERDADVDTLEGVELSRGFGVDEPLCDVWYRER